RTALSPPWLGLDSLLRGGAPQPLERALEIVGLHLLREAFESRCAVEERAEGPALLVEVVEARGVAVGQEPRPALDERLQIRGLDRGCCGARPLGLGLSRTRGEQRPKRRGQAAERLAQLRPKRFHA